MNTLFSILNLLITFQYVLSDTSLLDNEDKFISAGYFHTCALERRSGVQIGGGVKCWGDNRKGQLNSPPGIHRQISCGKFFSCAITAEYKISCWGEIEGAVPDGKFIQVSVGQSHACALEKNGKIKCWGIDNYGETKPPDMIFTQVSIS